MSDERDKPHAPSAPRPEYPHRRVSRRSFLRRATGGAALVGAVAPAGLAGCNVPFTQAPEDQEGATFSLFPRAPTEAGEEERAEHEADAARRGFLAMNTDWLSAGDHVFLKVASNSGEVHPAVTAPESVRGVVRALFELGAGRVIVGDQAGVQQVRLVEGEERFSSTRRMFERNGLLAAAEVEGADVHFFDDHGFEAGYFEASLPGGTAWKRPMMIPEVVREVDHILYLPRISSHMLAGYTHATKIAIGWLRDDSRRHLHHDAASFYEKYVEISFCDEIRNRFRGAYTFAPKLMLHQGPDFGTVFEGAPLIAVGSPHLGHHDALTAAILSHYDRSVGGEIQGLAYGPWADAANFLFLNFVVEDSTNIPWGPDGPEAYTSFVPHTYPGGIGADRALTHVYNLLGGVPPAIDVRSSGEELPTDLALALGNYSGGFLNLQRS